MAGHNSKKFEKFKVTGSVAAPFTPFRDNGEINFDKFEEYANYLRNHHFQYAFVNGTLAEGMSMTLEERKKSAEAWVKASNGKLKIILHVGTSNIRDSQELARHASAIGVDAIASLSPSFFKPANEEMVVECMSEIAGAAPDLPFFYYCINFVTGIYVDPSKVLKRARDKIPNLVGIKHSSRELNNAHNCTLVDPNRFQVLMGTDSQFLPYFTYGIDVPVTAPYMGTLFYKLKTAYDSEDTKSAQAIQNRILELNNIRGKYGAGIEIAKTMFGIISGMDIGPVRLPISKITTETYNSLKKDLNEFGSVE
uniref:N-acetylneuraminate lyase n=1 Tax=Magallana gigas TaxID=29159 RepID=A0A8W8HTP2_MAGGI|nr:N-acetylneuraminate lyase-like isoform X2 [Crassostrea gigas]